ncbi:efflux RND transporter periplasmic adaptor subunit [Hymenobacter ginsengisoli]|uniref:Efflux RND transporter periplasmic adaptor subunit n=1 Tax=Hymenobacter ginsengisoli TaxID=1051626 RepID=A0ABP8QLB7_9BACT|nr:MULTISPECIES: efflux RND transporter periplasmic adaptor subunit [unclassified Hymenobacter]MBO2033323.1 efflux RND transporter periplasmic adaptor subunit [Hymenobacter sp. BT559]
MSTEEKTGGTGRFWLVILILLLVFGGLFLVGFLPRLHHKKELDDEAQQQNTAKPVVTVLPAKAAPDTTTVTLPADLRSNHETFAFARVNGFVQSWTADIGQRVHRGQVLATIATPEIDQQIAQAQANLSLAQSSYNRLTSVSLPGAISKQELDAGKAQYAAQQAVVRQLQAQRGFRQVVAPFNGVVTQRNVEVGTLVTGGNATGTQLFKIEQTDTLRAFVDVPQNFVPGIRRGLRADVLVPEFPNQPFEGRVARDAASLDDQTRTLRTEVVLPNRGGQRQLRAGVYAQVRFRLPQTSPSVLISANALVPGIDPKVAVVQDGKIHFQPLTLGRDFGSTIEVTKGLRGGELLVINPAETLTEGLAVDTKAAPKPSKPAGPPPAKPRPNDPDAPRVSSPVAK